MVAALFLFRPPMSNASGFLSHSNPISDSHFSASFSSNRNSFRNPDLNPLSKPPKSQCFCFSSSSTATATAQSDDAVDIHSNGDSRPLSPESNISFSSEPLLRSDEAIKMPTAPWMKGPLLLPPDLVLDLSKRRKKTVSTNGKSQKPDCSLTERVRGARGKPAMKKILQGIRKLQKTTSDSEEALKNPEDAELDFPIGESREDENSKIKEKMPWEGEEIPVSRRIEREKVLTAAELTLDEELLNKLKREAARMRRWVKVKKAGVTQDVVRQVQIIWKDNELAMLKFDLPLCRNMDRSREIVEDKTGGLVVWTKKDALVVYRGCNYQLGLGTFPRMRPNLPDGSTIDERKIKKDVSRVETKLMNGSLYEREADRLLNGLGPRFTDWWMPKPLPVNADLLPEVVPGFKPPFRLCPPYARAKLRDDELTYLRKLARPLPTHFVLGRNRRLQGLAAAILKLWEKCHIVKIALKWGDSNTNNAEMANELKNLTGGVLLLRNKFLIIIYRGNDFLPCGVANLVVEREMELRACQLKEEKARLRAIDFLSMADESYSNSTSSGTLSEYHDIQSEYTYLNNGNREFEVQLESEKERLEKHLRNEERKLFILNMKIKRSLMELTKLNSAWRLAENDVDQEMITEEERECYRKIGLKMDSSLLLGRRGVFDGVVEGLHQHWKHREIVKVITMQRLLSQVMYTAKQLEAESGGILVSVDKLKEGHAIILYRGKNYRRPLKLVPQNLLNKRDALSRSLEMQRAGSLKFFAYQRQRAISELKCKLADLE